MNTKKKTIKTIVGSSLACSALILSGAGLACLKQPVLPVYAYGVPNIDAGLTNPNFNQSTSSTQPFSPTGYTAYSNGVKVDNNSNTESNVEAGVIKLTDEKYQSKFANALPSRPDDYVLMIDSTTENGGHIANYGYRTSSSVKMDANSKYILSVDVFTVTDSGIASIYLYNKDGEVVSSFIGINAHNDWETYTFFVQTNAVNAEEYYLGMYLEGKGIVLFDNLGGNKVSAQEYSTQKDVLDNKIQTDQIETDIYKTINNVDNVLNTFTISSTGGLFNTQDSSITNFEDVSYTSNSERKVVTDSDGENTHAMRLYNSTKTYGIYQTKQEFTFSQNRIYKVDVSVKVKNLDGQATLELIRTDDEETEHNKTITISSNTTSSDNKSVTNDYKTYSFVINCANNDVIYKLKAGLGNTENLTSGEMYISKIQISKINYETYNTTSGDNTASINFVKTYDGSSIMLNNGDFNGFEIKDYNSPMPANPTSWTVTTGANLQKYGVVNTKTFEEDLSSLGLSNLSNPSSSDNNNVLMMYNSQKDTLSYTSSSKSLTADTYHKFEIDVKSQNAPVKVSLISTIDSTEVTLVSKEVPASSSWKTVALYLHTGKQDLNISLKLTLDSQSYAYAYADNAKFDYLTAPTKEDFENVAETENIAIADLNDFLSSASNNNFETPNYFSKSNNEGVLAGTITLNTPNLLNTVINGETNLEVFNSIAQTGNDKKVLSIWSTEDVAYTLTSKLGYDLKTGEGNTYYKLTVKVFTQNIGSNDVDTDEKTIGAGIKMSGFDSSFTAIKSENSWTPYTFFIKAEKDTTAKLELSLGSEENLTKGAVFFGDITCETISADIYENAIDNETTKVLVAKSESSDDSSTETDSTENNENNSNINWWYLIPGLLTALAIIIAIVGFLMRKIKWKKPRKKAKNEYDRNKTISMQYYTRKATTLRETKVRELSQDLDKINSQRKQFEDDYKKELTRLREMKIKRANPSEIAKLEKELKKNQKMSASLGVTANRISEDLRYAKTDAYLNSLIRKLAKEQPQQENKPEESNEEI